MTIITPLQGSLKACTITYQPDETVLTPEALPQTEPGTPQVSYAVSSGNVPSFSLEPYAKEYAAVIYAAGQAVGVADTVYADLLVNGSSVATASQVLLLNGYYTFSGAAGPVVVGDTVELALWSGLATTNLKYKAFSVLLGLLTPIGEGLAFNLQVPVPTPLPVLASGNPAACGLFEDNGAGSGLIISRPIWSSRLDSMGEYTENPAIFLVWSNWPTLQPGLTATDVWQSPFLFAISNASYWPYYLNSSQVQSYSYRKLREPTLQLP